MSQPQKPPRPDAAAVLRQAGLSGDIMLGGRLFNIVDYDVITVANEAYIHKLMRETGLDVPLPFKDGESEIEYQVRMQARVIDTLKLPEILGGFLLPAGKTERDWTEQMAAETSTFIRGLTDRRDREEVFRLAFLMNIYFFGEGRCLLERSQSSFENSRQSPSEQSASHAAH